MRLLYLALLFAVAASAQAVAQERLATGAALFESRCSGACHQAPELQQLNAKQWQVVLNTMQLRMKQFGMAPLNADEYESILDYLTSQAK